MTSWSRVRLGDHIRVKHGFAFQGEYFRDHADYVVLTPGNFVETGGFKPKSGAEKYYAAAPPPNFLLRRGDLVIAMTEQAQGLLGSSALIPADNTYLHNQRIGLVEQCSNDTNRRFLYYLFNTRAVRDQIQATATGSKVRHTAPERVESVIVSLPPLASQRKIAAVLSAYDDFIENNNRRIKLLEEMAQRIYREWFVEFRYPGHASVGLVPSELGQVPTSWEVRPLFRVADVIRGRSYRSDELVEVGGRPFVNLKCLRRGGGFRVDGLKRYNGKHDPDQEVREGDIVLGVTDLTQEREILARATLVPSLEEGFGIISLDVVKIVPHIEQDRLALFFILSATDFADRVKGYANGSTVLHLSPSHVAQNKLVWPPQGLRTRFVAIVDPMIALINALAEEQKRLSETRDLLLPRLMSGEIDVTDLEIGLPEEAA